MEVQKEWTAYLIKERASFDTIFSKDIFSDWETARQPEEKAERCLGYALELRYGRDTTNLSEQFLGRCLSVVDRILKEQRFDTGFVGGYEPSTARAKALRARTFANALLGKRLDVESLREAAPEFVTWALHERWDDHSEDAYLISVRLLLITGDVKRAADLLGTRKKFKWHGDQAEILRRIVMCKARPIDDQALLSSFDAVFDPLRAPFMVGQWPYTNRKITRIELGAVRDKYFVSPIGEIDWDRTVGAISR